MNYVALISYVSNIPSDDDEDDPEQASCLRTFRHLVHSIRTTSPRSWHPRYHILLPQSRTKVHCHPTSRLLNPTHIVQGSRLSAHIYYASNTSRTGYAASAIVQITSSLVSHDMSKLIS